MKLPPSLIVSPSSSVLMVCKMNKFLYGLRQVSRQWYAKLSKALHSRGYRHSLNDNSLFTKGSGDFLVILVVYVDDIILTGTNLQEIFDLKLFLHDQFKLKDLGLLHYFLGIEILSCSSCILLHQSKFVHDLLKEYNCDVSSLVVCPFELHKKLFIDMGDPLAQPEVYRSLIGKLNFFTHTRPDLSFVVQHLIQYLQRPCAPHMQVTLHLLRYLKSSPNLGLFYNDSPDFTLQVFCDSDWASCPDSRRSVTGFCVLLGANLIS